MSSHPWHCHLQPQPYDPRGDLCVTQEHTQHVPFSRLSTLLLAHGHGAMQGFPHGTASMALLSPACSQGGAAPQDGDVGLTLGSAQSLAGRHHITATSACPGATHLSTAEGGPPESSAAAGV